MAGEALTKSGGSSGNSGNGTLAGGALRNESITPQLEQNMAGMYNSQNELTDKTAYNNELINQAKEFARIKYGEEYIENEDIILKLADISDKSTPIEMIKDGFEQFKQIERRAYEKMMNMAKTQKDMKKSAAVASSSVSMGLDKEGVDYWNMSQEEFEERRNKALRK